MTVDLGFKITSVITSIIVIPLFGWVWTTNTDVRQLEFEHSDAVEDVKELKQQIHTKSLFPYACNVFGTFRMRRGPGRPLFSDVCGDSFES